MAIIYVREKESADSMIRRFKKAVEKEGIFKELKKREYFKKPSVIRRENRIEAKKRELKLLRKIKELDAKEDEFR